MRKHFKLVVLFVIATMLLAACGDPPAATPVPATATTAPAAETATTAPEAGVTATSPQEPAVDDTATTAPAADDTATTAPETEATPTVAIGKPSEEGVLTLWVQRLAVPAVTAAGQQFTAKYNIPVSVQELEFGQIRDQLKTAGPAGEGPDIIAGAHDWLGELVTNGLVEPLDLGASAANFDPVTVQAFTYEGKVYGLPYALEAIALLYNKDLVPEAPKTWEELKTIAKQLQDEGKVDQGFVLMQGDPYHSYPLWTGFGGYVFKQNPDGTYDPSDVGLDNPGGIKAMTEIDQMIKDGLLRPDITGQIGETLFATGKSAMTVGGPWRLADLRKAGINYGIAPLPMMDEQPAPFVGSQGFMVSAFGKNKDIAKAFLTEFMAADEPMRAMYEADPRIPAWLPVQKEVAASTDPSDVDIAGFAQSATLGRPMPAIPQMSAVWEDWTKAINLVFQQQEEPAKAITDAANTIRGKLTTP
ncbi:MAG TPA: maltose ABC transporter substrate-binding protein [Chloroflexia bacterium]|jgi:maltose/maltodextrin transport system substrate-binding protein/arabinogalactan oligomer/maltooligosaccharide transport system substrate-binding protein